jgi:hypothetical protein
MSVCPMNFFKYENTYLEDYIREMGIRKKPVVHFHRGRKVKSGLSVCFSYVKIIQKFFRNISLENVK